MKKTLISFIGKGQIDKQNTDRYPHTTYDFGNDLVCESKCFAEAIRKCGKFEFDKVIFIGTSTSSWSVLLEALEEQELDFWSHLFDNEQAQKPLAETDKNKLIAILQKLWGIPVELSIYPPALLPENSLEALNRCIDSLLQCGNRILLDITHSFRWMPVLLTSVLQFRNAYSADGNGGGVEIIYGEFNKGVSPVRQLDILVQGQQISRAIALFFQKFEAEPLSKELTQFWQSGANAIKNLGSHLQGNHFLPLLFDLKAKDYPPSQILNQLKNACEKNFDENRQPEWVKVTRSKLLELHQKLTTGDQVTRLISLAELLAERKLYGQAVMCMCLAVEQYALLVSAYSQHPGYDKLQGAMENLKTHIKQKDVKIIKNIEHLRNQVAHGGLGKDNFSNVNSLEKEYKELLKDFHKIRENN